MTIKVRVEPCSSLRRLAAFFLTTAALRKTVYDPHQQGFVGILQHKTNDKKTYRLIFKSKSRCRCPSTSSLQYFIFLPVAKVPVECNKGIDWEKPTTFPSRSFVALRKEAAKIFVARIINEASYVSCIRPLPRKPSRPLLAFPLGQKYTNKLVSTTNKFLNYTAYNKLSLGRFLQAICNIFRAYKKCIFCSMRNWNIRASLDNFEHYSRIYVGSFSSPSWEFVVSYD